MKVRKINFEKEKITIILPKEIEMPLEIARNMPPLSLCVLLLFKLLGCEIKGEKSEITIKQPQRNYYVKFTKYDVYRGNIYQDNCGFCVKDLHSYCIKRPFDSDNTVVENLVVKEIKTNKIIYQGKSYEEYLKVIGGSNNESNTNER